LIYINDLDYGIRNWILKFADDTKVFSRANGSEDCASLQKDLDTLVNWSEECEEWQMLFNVGQCKVMHFGRNNPSNDNYMKSQKLEITDTEKHLGIVITSNLKSAQQCSRGPTKHRIGRIDCIGPILYPYFSFLADRTATQYDRLLAAACCPSVCPSVCLSVTLCIVALRVGVEG